jgi:hypothetical protein
VSDVTAKVGNPLSRSSFTVSASAFINSFEGSAESSDTSSRQRITATSSDRQLNCRRIAAVNAEMVINGVWRQSASPHGLSISQRSMVRGMISDAVSATEARKAS